MSKKNNWEYLLSKGIIDSLLESGLITNQEHKRIDSLNIASFS